MAKFVSKPVEIDAIQFTGDNYDEIVAAFGEEGILEVKPKLTLKTDDNTFITCEIGSWVVPGNKSKTFYPINDADFQAKYKDK